MGLIVCQFFDLSSYFIHRYGSVLDEAEDAPASDTEDEAYFGELGVAPQKCVAKQNESASSHQISGSENSSVPIDVCLEGTKFEGRKSLNGQFLTCSRVLTWKPTERKNAETTCTEVGIPVCDGIATRKLLSEFVGSVRRPFLLLEMTPNKSHTESLYFGCC